MEHQIAALEEGWCAGARGKQCPFYYLRTDQYDTLFHTLRQQVQAALAWDGDGYFRVPQSWYIAQYEAHRFEGLYGLGALDFCRFLNASSKAEIDENRKKGRLPWTPIDRFGQVSRSATSLQALFTG